MFLQKILPVHVPGYLNISSFGYLVSLITENAQPLNILLDFKMVIYICITVHVPNIH